MRLTGRERDIILESLRKWFPEAGRVFLFGSRVDDAKKGGDIDLLVETEAPEAERYVKAIRAITDMQLRMGERKIDLVVAYPEGTPADAKDRRTIVRIARSMGVRLDTRGPDEEGQGKTEPVGCG